MLPQNCVRLHKSQLQLLYKRKPFYGFGWDRRIYFVNSTTIVKYLIKMTWVNKKITIVRSMFQAIRRAVFLSLLIPLSHIFSEWWSICWIHLNTLQGYPQLYYNHFAHVVSCVSFSIFSRCLCCCKSSLDSWSNGILVLSSKDDIFSSTSTNLSMENPRLKQNTAKFNISSSILCFISCIFYLWVFLII